MTTFKSFLFDVLPSKMGDRVYRQLISSIRQVLSVVNDNDSELDDLSPERVEEILARFRAEKASAYAPISLAEYQRRFRRAVTMYKSYLESDSKDDWRPQLRPGRAPRIRITGAPTLVGFPLNLSHGRAVLYLPPYLTSQEAERLIALIKVIAMPTTN